MYTERQAFERELIESISGTKQFRDNRKRIQESQDFWKCSNNMDQETLFTGSKWDILKLLEQKKMSPIELANASGTSTANISQQLRFLEIAGIVKSERISNRDKGQPRILYSLAGNSSFLISVAPGFVNKKLSYDLIDIEAIAEHVKYSWYSQSNSNVHPAQGLTEPETDKEAAYSWLKAPRYNGMPCEV
ncbi:MAG: nickel-dependent hydrogenase large subunit, partial [Nanoarchaeota archaeon]|nr:nickel-dependent hydrogenase large subunit [Nanoarchaeota archaeon]